MTRTRRPTTPPETTPPRVRTRTVVTDAEWIAQVVATERSEPRVYEIDFYGWVR